MKYIVVTVLLLSSFLAFAKDCRPPEKYYEGHYLGYLAVTERKPQSPLLMWWKDEYDELEYEHDPRLSGLEILSDKRIFKQAKYILKKKKTDTYLLAWPDTIYISNEKIDVVKVSVAFSKQAPAYNVAFKEIVLEPKNKEGDKTVVTESIELGCAANLLK